MFEKIARSPKFADSYCKFLANFCQNSYPDLSFWLKLDPYNNPKYLRPKMFLKACSWKKFILFLLKKFFLNLHVGLQEKKNPALRDYPSLQKIIKILFSFFEFILTGSTKPVSLICQWLSTSQWIFVRVYHFLIWFVGCRNQFSAFPPGGPAQFINIITLNMEHNMCDR